MFAVLHKVKLIRSLGCGKFGNASTQAEKYELFHLFQSALRLCRHPAKGLRIAKTKSASSFFSATALCERFSVASARCGVFFADSVPLPRRPPTNRARLSVEGRGALFSPCMASGVAKDLPFRCVVVVSFPSRPLFWNGATQLPTVSVSFPVLESLIVQFPTDSNMFV